MGAAEEENRLGELESEVIGVWLEGIGEGRSYRVEKLKLMTKILVLQ
jgi:hypothetical protein